MFVFINSFEVNVAEVCSFTLDGCIFLLILQLNFACLHHVRIALMPKNILPLTYVAAFVEGSEC